MKTCIAALILAAGASLSACSPDAPPESAGENTSVAPAAAAPDGMPVAAVSASVTPAMDGADFTGRWTGVEGTYMTITEKGGTAYEVVIADLDGPKTYQGTLQADGLHVDRNGTPLVIHKGDGAATGMKWLDGKQDCLVVAANEGYCRD